MARTLVCRAADPLASSGTVPSVAPVVVSSNRTLPAGVGPGAPALVTVAVKATVCPNTDGLIPLATVVVVGAGGSTAVYVYASASWPTRPNSVRTRTAQTPAGAGGVVARISVSVSWLTSSSKTPPAQTKSTRER